jgi:hypothetical protein
MLEGFGWRFRAGRDDGGGNASAHARGDVSDPEALREAELAERAAQQARERADGDRMEGAIESGRQAGQARVDAAQQKVREATEAWQRARQAHARAAAGEKAAAEARVKEALAARMATIEAVGAAREEARSAQSEQRTRATGSRDAAYRLERVQQRIGPDYEAGDKLLAMLAVWVREAAANPVNPRSFTPLFLAEMARLQDPPVDLLGSAFARPGRGEGRPWTCAAPRAPPSSG